MCTQAILKIACLKNTAVFKSGFVWFKIVYWFQTFFNYCKFLFYLSFYIGYNYEDVACVKSNKRTGK